MLAGYLALAIMANLKGLFLSIDIAGNMDFNFG